MARYRILIFSFVCMLLFSLGSCVSYQKNDNSDLDARAYKKALIYRAMMSSMKVEKKIVVNNVKTNVNGINVVISSGSAVYVETDANKNESLALTAAHVCVVPIDKVGMTVLGTYYIVKFKFEVLSYNGARYEAEPLYSDESTDVCVLRVLGPAPMTVEMAQVVPEKVSEQVFHVGAPVGVMKKGVMPLTYGTYSGVWEFDPEDNIPNKWLMFSIPAAAGSSGGGIFNEKGQLVSVVSMGAGLSPWTNIIWCPTIESVNSAYVEAYSKWLLMRE